MEISHTLRPSLYHLLCLCLCFSAEPPVIRAAEKVPGKELQPDAEAGDFFAVCKTAD